MVKMDSWDEALLIAAKGFKAATDGQYETALNLLTTAIKTYPDDWRFYNNRSFVHYFLATYTMSLNDADAAIQVMQKENGGKNLSAKPWFRRGLALFELKRFLEAESTFATVLAIDPTCEASKDYRVDCRKILLSGAGLMPNIVQKVAEDFQQSIAIFLGVETNGLKDPIQNGSVNLVSNGHNGSRSVNDDVDFGEPRPTAANGYKQVTDEVKEKAPHLMESDSRLLTPTNIFGFKSVCVTNIRTDVSKERIHELFDTFGKITGLGKASATESFAIIIHYDNPKSPAAAIASLRDKIFTNGVTENQMKPLQFRFVLGRDQKDFKMSLSEAMATADMHGECFAWRSTFGCSEGANCEYPHDRINCRIDTSSFITDPVPSTSDSE